MGAGSRNEETTAHCWTQGARTEERTVIDTAYGREIVDDPDAFRRELLELIDSGKQIILDQGATGIGGGYPDWVTVWIKDEE